MRNARKGPSRNIMVVIDGQTLDDLDFRLSEMRKITESAEPRRHLNRSSVIRALIQDWCKKAELGTAHLAID